MCLILAQGTYCGLCGKTSNLTRTECCNRPICNDTLSYDDRASCYRNHHGYSLCYFHHSDRHEGTNDWRECNTCMTHAYCTERTVAFGSSRSNFAEQRDRWDPPAFEPVRCCQCNKTIKVNVDTHSRLPDGTTTCSICLGFWGSKWSREYLAVYSSKYKTRNRRINFIYKSVFQCNGSPFIRRFFFSVRRCWSWSFFASLHPLSWLEVSIDFPRSDATARRPPTCFLIKNNSNQETMCTICATYWMPASLHCSNSTYFDTPTYWCQRCSSRLN